MLSGNERSERRLVIPEAIQAAIAQLLAIENWQAEDGREDSLIPADRPYALDLAGLLAVEEALGARLGDEALALLAAESAFLRDRFGIDLAQIPEHTAAARASGVPSSLVAIGRAGDRFLCVAVQPTAGERPRIVVAQAGSAMRRESLERWLLELSGELQGDLELSEGQQRRLGGDEVLERFIPRLIAASPIAASVAGPRRAAHPKFGEGTILREVMDGPERKLEIDFDHGGRRLLLARFVKELDRAS